MSLRIYLDECAYSRPLTAKLRKAGHDVLTPLEARTMGLSDRVHLERAINEKRLVVTHNRDDFDDLHREFVSHPGIAGVYKDNDPSRDMTYDHIVAALHNLEASGLPLENGFHALNVWR